MLQSTTSTRLHIFLFASLIAVTIWSFIDHFELFAWILDAGPPIIGMIILVAVYERFRFTNLTYIQIWIHAVFLLIGAHYTYTRVPLLNWIKDVFDLSRNHYDRIGHILQGFVPAVIAREVLLRKSPLQRGGWLFTVVVSFCMAVSAVYEVFEWLVSVSCKDKAVTFLATQGDKWDTQKDMALCLVGAVAALMLMSKWQDRKLKELSGSVD